jgi:glycoside/pentoside/hexuronide:cation symporter, GPH family
MPRKLTFSSKFGYGTGSTIFAVKDTAFNTFLLFYYTQVLGLSGTLSGMALLIGLMVDAVTDPLMGSVSDNFRSRFGRRHPFMGMAAIPLSISFYLLFAPPSGMDQTGLFAWLTTFVICVRVMLTVFQVPYLALGAELSEDYVERTTIATYRTSFGFFSGVTIAIIAYSIFFPQTKAYLLGQMNAEGYPGFGLFCAVIITVMAAACIYLTRKEIPVLPVGTQSQQPLRIRRLLEELKMALKNHSFRIVFIASLFSGTIGGVYVNLGLHLNTYFWELDSKTLAFLSTSILFSAVISFVIMRWLEKIEKKTAFIVICLMSSLVGFIVVLRLLELLPENGSPLLFRILYLNTLYWYTLIIIQTILVASIIADTVDEGELITGVRQEGMYFAFLTFSTKAFSGLGTLFAGLIIDFIGLPAKVSPEAVDPEVIWNLGFFYGPVQGILWIIPILIFLRLRLSRQRLTEIRQKLTIRKTV